MCDIVHLVLNIRYTTHRDKIKNHGCTGKYILLGMQYPVFSYIKDETVGNAIKFGFNIIN